MTRITSMAYGGVSLRWPIASSLEAWLVAMTYRTGVSLNAARVEASKEVTMRMKREQGVAGPGGVEEHVSQIYMSLYVIILERRFSKRTQISPHLGIGVPTLLHI